MTSLLPADLPDDLLQKYGKTLRQIERLADTGVPPAVVKALIRDVALACIRATRLNELKSQQSFAAVTASRKEADELRPGAAKAARKLAAFIGKHPDLSQWLFSHADVASTVALDAYSTKVTTEYWPDDYEDEKLRGKPRLAGLTPRATNDDERRLEYKKRSYYLREWLNALAAELENNDSSKKLKKVEAPDFALEAGRQYHRSKVGPPKSEQPATALIYELEFLFRHATGPSPEEPIKRKSPLPKTGEPWRSWIRELIAAALPGEKPLTSRQIKERIASITREGGKSGESI